MTLPERPQDCIVPPEKDWVTPEDSNHELRLLRGIVDEVDPRAVDRLVRSNLTPAARRRWASYNIALYRFLDAIAQQEDPTPTPVTDEWSHYDAGYLCYQSNEGEFIGWIELKDGE